MTKLREKRVVRLHHRKSISRYGHRFKNVGKTNSDARQEQCKKEEETNLTGGRFFRSRSLDRRKLPGVSSGAMSAANGRSRRNEFRGSRFFREKAVIVASAEKPIDTTHGKRRKKTDERLASAIDHENNAGDKQRLADEGG